MSVNFLCTGPVAPKIMGKIMTSFATLFRLQFLGLCTLIFLSFFNVILLADGLIRHLYNISVFVIFNEKCLFDHIIPYVLCYVFWLTYGMQLK